jgi:hypothetical protein
MQSNFVGHIRLLLQFIIEGKSRNKSSHLSKVTSKSQVKEVKSQVSQKSENFDLSRLQVKSQVNNSGKR